jgi:hypothetical protein
VFKVVCCSKEAFYFFHAEDDGELFYPGPRGNVKINFIPFANIPVEADNARKIVIASPPGNITIFKKITKIFLNLLVCKLVWRLHVEFC